MTTDATAGTTPDYDDANRHLVEGRRKKILAAPTFWILIIDVALFAAFGLLSPNWIFFNSGNLSNMALDAAQGVALAAVLSLLLGAGQLDISVGANIILASVIGGKVAVALSGTSAEVSAGDYPSVGVGIAVGVLAAVMSGVAFGSLNAFIVVRMRVNSFIATLGTLGMGTGAALVITGGVNVDDIPPQLRDNFGALRPLGVPLPALLSLAVVAGLWFLLTKTPFGTRILAIGSSSTAAERAGIPIGRYLTVLFLLVGLVAGLAAILDLSRFSTTNLSGHQTDALAAIAGAVIGGTALFGGRASVVGAALGAVLAVILQTGLIILGFSPFYQLIAIGAVLILAVWLRGGDAKSD